MTSPSPSSAAAAAAAPTSAVVAASVSSAPGKICFNKHCKESKSEAPARRKGWRLRSGDFADLCDRCSTSYEQGSFCETFHSDGDGWRKCGSCGKRVHCGCIVSVTTFVLLDAGGIECVACAQKHFVMVPNQMWPSSLFVPLTTDRLKDLPTKSWNHITSTTPVPGQWRQAPNSWSAAIAGHSDLQTRLSYEFDRPSGIEKLFSGVRSAVPEKKKIEDLPERPAPSTVNKAALDRLVNGNSGLRQSGFSAFHRDDGSVDGMHNSGHLVDNNDPVLTRKVIIHGSRISSSTGIKTEPISNSCGNIPIGSTMLKDDSATTMLGLPSSFSSPIDANDPSKLSANQAPLQPPPSFAKQIYRNTSNALDAGGDTQNQMRNGRPRLEGRGRSQLLPRYWPRITDQELQQISGDSNSVITPLFEKMLSASDAGRIGRLVLPKKCAEAYFPAISQPEGLPLKVQDASGKEWVFQFRFWPNNNSRMYVLEGVTPCIQSMQLQAGDTVTFSRIDPEGKLVMGFRKASNIQGEQVVKAGNGFPQNAEANNRNSKQSESPSFPPRTFKGSPELSSSSNATEQATNCKFDKPGSAQKEEFPTKPTVKRKGSSLGSKTKRLRIENEDSIELKLTWEEAQELLRPPPNHSPSVVVIEGHEIEEYEEAPVLGKPTIFTTNQAGGKDQWAQCEDCSKWRKLPLDALLPPRWTCFDNSWDPDRSSCSSAQEITKEQLAELLPPSATSKRRKNEAENNIVEGSDGLDTLANLAILGEGELPPYSSQPTTKHPRHRPGCTCIVCIQPPSGKGPKHKQTCTCNVCLTVRRRFRTLMLRKEKRQSEKEAETARKKQQQVQMQSSEAAPQQEDAKPITSKNAGSQSKKMATTNDGVVDEDSDRRKELLSSIKTEIDLNIQPEREEEPSPVSDAGNMMRLLQDAA